MGGLPIANAYATGHPHNVGYTRYISTGYGGYGYGGYGGYGLYGKREAEAEAKPYTIGQVAYGLPIANAYATGHPHNVGYTRFISTGYGYGGYGGYGAYGVYGKREAEADAYYGAVPSLTVGGYTQVASPFHYGYGIGVYGKREAMAEAEAEPYTIGQVAYGLPIANAYATGHP